MKSLTFLQAAAGAPQGSGMSFLIMIVLIFVVMWLFMIRPQQKKQKELNKFRDSLKKGDKVVTVGGIYGTIAEVKEGSAQVLIEVDKDVKLKVDKASLVKDFSDAQQS
ncbi:MAG: preprotein translocase subunit YajC [Bacteroidales bacterium]|nr:preprotein translocase subunit YajC [Candidatus Cacconaster caballi]